MAFFTVKVVEIAFLVDLFDSHLAYTVVSAFAVLPDIDIYFKKLISHRTYTHTLYSSVIVSIFLIPFGLKMALIGFLAYLSHLIGDMMTVSGVKLFYPNQTVYYLLPPNWRIKTSSSSEFAFLGVLIISSMLIGYVVTEKAELTRIFELSKENDVTVRLSWIENGVIHDLDRVKVVWTDYKSKIGFIQNGKLKIINDEQILDIEVLDFQRVDREIVHKTVRVKELKRSAWRNKLIVSYDDKDFLGTGRDLYELLKENSSKKVRVAYVCSKSSPSSQNLERNTLTLTTFINLIDSLSQELHFIVNWTS